MSTSLTSDRISSLSAQLVKQQPEMAKLVPTTSKVRPESIVRAVLTEVRLNPKLADCSPVSVIKCAMECAQLGLLPSRVTQHVYLVPFKDECTLIVGYKGLVQLAQRSGLVGEVSVQVVHKADKFMWSLGDGESILHEPAWQLDEKERGPVIAYYCIVRSPAGQTMARRVMTPREIDAVMVKAPGYKRPDSIWRTDYVAMARKTVVRRALAMAPMALDDSVIAIGSAIEGEVEVSVPQEEVEIRTVPERKSDAALLKQVKDAIRKNPERAGELWGGTPPDLATASDEVLADMLKKLGAA